ncbi:RagB/SusD family nutrient uptake outer membrane protein [Chitinophaga lutea]
MKRSILFYTNILLAGLLLAGAPSCKKALEEDPRSIAVEGFYNTPSEVESAANAMYAPLRTTAMVSAIYVALMEAQSDFLIPNGSWIPLGTYTGLDNTNYGRTGGVWTNLYLTIRNANLIIRHAPNGTGLNDQQKQRYVGEAKFMRALCYFHLARHWAGVPLRTDNNLDSVNLPRATETAVYQLIEEDLQYAAQHLPETAPQAGRPTKWSARTVLADVYLQRKKYPAARDMAREVISSGRHSLVPVSQPDDFLNLYGPDLISTSEEIFYLKFSRQTGQALLLTLYEAHPGTPYANGAGLFSLYTDPTQVTTIRDWDPQDLRKQFNLYPWKFGRGDNTMLVKKYQDRKALPNGAGGNDYPWYRYADLLLIYAEAANAANQGPTAEAVEALNEVHRRAYGYNPKTASPVDFRQADYNEAAFLRLIVKERGYETLFEGKRWLELKRLGIAKEYIRNAKGKEMNDALLLWPLPNAELNYNKAMDPVKDQNPGY